MGSKLELKSTPGEGSSFYFDVSFKSEQGDALNWANISEVKNVLIVDDNENNRHIVSAMLALKGIYTIEAANGFEALQLLTQGNAYDAIVMDYHMPYMDGLETIRKIRENFSRTAQEQPIILLHSSSDDGKIIKECDELDVVYRLVKPLKMQDIYHALSRLHQKDTKATLVTELENQPSEAAFNVLIAEDNAVNMLLTRTIIGKITPNATITEARNGFEALSYCRRQLPDLILMDVQMPEMNGYEATHAIRGISSHLHIPIVALTAGNVKGEKEKCLAAGMDDFVVKPIVENNIIAIFNKWLDLNKDDGLIKTPEFADEGARHFNINKLKSYLGDDDFIINEVLSLVKTELITTRLAMEKHITGPDMSALNSIGHKLYGTAISSGMYLLSGMASELEQLSGLEVDRELELIGEIEKEINIVLSTIGDRN